MIPNSKLNSGFFGAGNDTHALPVNHCATCGHYREWHVCCTDDLHCSRKAADMACERYTTERASDLIDDYNDQEGDGLPYFR